MIDFSLLCADLENRRSGFSGGAREDIGALFALLRHPNSKTAVLLAGWREDFRELYGDLPDIRGLDAEYGLALAPEELPLLILAIQTYFALLLKLLLKDALAEEDRPTPEFVLCRLPARYGIGPDWFCWPVFALGFARILTAAEARLVAYRVALTPAAFCASFHADSLKRIYEALIPGPLRHALGEYYTPGWLAEYTLRAALGGAPLGTRTVLDPTCGSGAFLLQALREKRREGLELGALLASVRGIDVNPLAVLTAKVNLLLSLLDLLPPGEPVRLPVTQADVLRLGEAVPEMDVPDFLAADDPCQAVRAYGAAQRREAQGLPPAELLIGNPPWVNWEYLPEPCRARSQRLWQDYGLFAAKGPALSFAKEDISVLITYVAADRLLRPGGDLALVLRQGVFKSAKNGAGFRRFLLPGPTPLGVTRAEDLSRIPVFENTATKTALFFARKGTPTVYPVPWLLWEKRRRGGFGAYAPLAEVLAGVTITRQSARPSEPENPASPWLNGAEAELAAMERLLGSNGYRARTGVFTGGANAVYWLRLTGGGEETVLAENLTARAKRQAEPVTARLESTYVYPMLRGSGVRKWKTRYDSYLLCPHTAATKQRPVPEATLAETAPETLSYLRRFRPVLDSRQGFAGWEKEIQRQEFHALLRVGAYTFAPYKVVWKYIATEFVCAVISTVDDPWLGPKLLLPNEKLMYVGLEDEEEAYYLCGLLSAGPVAACVKSYMNPTSISAHVLGRLRLPAYDPGDPLHREIARLCREGHRADNIAPCLQQLDTLVIQLYNF